MKNAGEGKERSALSIWSSSFLPHSFVRSLTGSLTGFALGGTFSLAGALALGAALGLGAGFSFFATGSSAPPPVPPSVSFRSAFLFAGDIEKDWKWARGRKVGLG